MNDVTSQCLTLNSYIVVVLINVKRVEAIMAENGESGSQNKMEQCLGSQINQSKFEQKLKASHAIYLSLCISFRSIWWCKHIVNATSWKSVFKFRVNTFKRKHCLKHSSFHNKFVYKCKFCFLFTGQEDILFYNRCICYVTC